MHGCLCYLRDQGICVRCPKCRIVRDEPSHLARCIGLGGLIRTVGQRPDGDEGVILGHALRRTDDDTLIIIFLLIVCNIPIIGLNH